MNFLALCQRAASECGVSGTITTTAGQVGSVARIVSWVGDSWNDIQCAHDDWIWMRASNILGSGISITPAAAQYNIPLGTGAGQVGVGDHAHIGPGVILGGQAGVLSGKTVTTTGTVLWGTPAKPLREYLRELATLARLSRRGKD